MRKSRSIVGLSFVTACGLVLVACGGGGGHGGGGGFAAGPSLPTQTFAEGFVGLAYSATPAETGGTAPFTWSVSSGALPSGLVQSPTSGTIAGTPTTPGSFAFTLKVTDATGAAATQSYSITVAASLVSISPGPGALPDATSGTPYSVTFTASGGTAPYSGWSNPGSGVLPPGLTFAQTSSTTAVLSGTPTTKGTFSFEVSVNDSLTTGDTQTNMVTVK